MSNLEVHFIVEDVEAVVTIAGEEDMVKELAEEKIVLEEDITTDNKTKAVAEVNTTAMIVVAIIARAVQPITIKTTIATATLAMPTITTSGSRRSIAATTTTNVPTDMDTDGETR